MRIRLACAMGVLLSVPINVLALGLGPMQTSSSLNEPFEAKIPLVDAKVDELDTLKVGLANRAQFKRAGLDYALTLSDLRFELVQPKAGSDYVRIWSKEPIREPVLDFLVEVNWSSGRLIRELTVLLDPPRYEPTVGAAPPRPAATVSPRPRPTQSSPVADTPAADTPTGSTSDQYGPTQAGDTLWGIAQGARSGEVSMQQMMLALLQANPHAFVNANMNHLKQGQILRIPQASELSSHTQAEALAEVRRHNSLWEEYRQRVASSVPERSVGVEGSQGTALGSEEEQRSAEGARLEVLGAAGSAAAQPSAAGEGELGEGTGTEAAQLVAEESQAVSEDENSHLRQRLKESEDLVELMRRQVQLKDDELAALQAKVAQAGTAVPEAVQTPAGEPIAEQPGATEAGAETAARSDELQVTEVPVPTEPTVPVAEAGPAATPSGAATETAAPSRPDEAGLGAGVPTESLLPEPGPEALAAAEATGEPGVPPVADSPATAEAPAATTEPGDALADVTPPDSETQQEGAAAAVPAPVEDAPLIPGGIYSIIGLIAVAGMVVFWVFWRIRAKSRGGMDEDQRTVEHPSPLAGTRADEDEEVVERTLEDLQKHAYDDDVVEAEMEQEAERTRFPTEPAAEKDPLEEVNLCIAYERFDEAEQLIKNAIAVQPGRHDYKLRLLEVYYAAGNKGAYERAARELSTAVGGRGPLWDNAMAMWYEMSPERPLFAEQSGEDADWQDETDAQREVFDITSESGGEPWKSESSSERSESEMPGALDFDLGTTYEEEESATPISARGGSEEEAGEYTDVFDLSSPEDMASEGIVDVTAVGEDSGEDAQMFDLTAAETTSGTEDVIDLTATDSQRGVDQEMLDLAVADDAGNADDIFDLTTSGSGYQDDRLDFDVTGGHRVPETAEESEDALNLTVPKATFLSAKPPEPEEQVFEITHPKVADEDPFVVDADNANNETGDGEMDLGRSDAQGDAAREQQAAWSAYRDAEERVQNEVNTPSEEKAEARAGHEHMGSSPPEEGLEVENVKQNVTMSNTAQVPQATFATESGGASEVGENNFVVTEDLTAAEEIVAIDLTDTENTQQIEGTQELERTQERDRIAKTVKLPRTFPAADGEPSDLDSKLNLAKAYIELGDPKGARDILDEVAHSGSDAQKQDAETLRRQLG